MVSLSVAVPAPQQKNDGNLDSLISSVFGGSSTPAPDATNRNTSGDLGSLIDNVFGQSTTTQRPILGTQNKQRPKPTDCECVPYYQCREGTILDNGIGLIDIRSDFGDDNNSASTISNSAG